MRAVWKIGVLPLILGFFLVGTVVAVVVLAPVAMFVLMAIAVCWGVGMAAIEVARDDGSSHS